MKLFKKELERIPTSLVFKINDQLTEVFNKETAKINSGNFIFVFNSLKTDIKKVFKIIASLIEDQWSAQSVRKEQDKNEGWVSVQAKRRKKLNFMFPEKDDHFNRKKDRYQYHTFLAALSFVSQYRSAIDVGGHVGLYSSAMLDVFENVSAFEPSILNAKCFAANAPRAKLYPYGLGEQDKVVDLHIADDNSGNNSIVESFGDKKIPIQIKTLDSFNFNNIDLIKIDVQGYEEQVILGARKTLIDNHPIIIAELITHKDSPPNQVALDLLINYGYKTLMIMGKDYILG